MRVECIHCGKQYSLRDENAGAHFKCQRCGKISPVAAVTAAAAEPTVTDNVQLDTARQRPTAEPAIACPSCGKRHRLPPNAAAGRYKCSACGASMPKGEANAHSMSADQVVWAEVLPVPGATLPSTSELTSPSPTDDLFSGALPPTSGHVRAQVAVSAVVDESDSPYKLAPAIVEAVPALRPLPAKPGPKPKNAASKKSKRSRSETDFQPLLRSMGGGAAVIVGVVLVLWGLLVLFDTSDSGRFGTRRPLRCIGVGVSLIAFGRRLLTAE